VVTDYKYNRTLILG